ncbi:hypothetical protein ACJJIK_12745 [Microbulbifer sp. ZKSA006]|uniref:hypothetical protein n=1 Tax=Microbulbifer sp. ZKSA006 TaxID=3243390 RepID=UPI0040394573
MVGGSAVFFPRKYWAAASQTMAGKVLVVSPERANYNQDRQARPTPSGLDWTAYALLRLPLLAALHLQTNGELMNYLIGFIFLVVGTLCHAGSIGFGQVIAVKQYDLGSNESVKIYLSENSTNVNTNCIENGNVYGVITPSSHDESTINRMFSLATAAYMSGKKLRLHSETDSCEVDFVAVQESVF